MYETRSNLGALGASAPSTTTAPEFDEIVARFFYPGFNCKAGIAAEAWMTCASEPPATAPYKAVMTWWWKLNGSDDRQQYRAAYKSMLAYGPVTAKSRKEVLQWWSSIGKDKRRTLESHYISLGFWSDVSKAFDDAAKWIEDIPVLSELGPLIRQVATPLKLAAGKKVSVQELAHTFASQATVNFAATHASEVPGGSEVLALAKKIGVDTSAAAESSFVNYAAGVYAANGATPPSLPAVKQLAATVHKEISKAVEKKVQDYRNAYGVAPSKKIFEQLLAAGTNDAVNVLPAVVQKEAQKVAAAEAAFKTLTQQTADAAAKKRADDARAAAAEAARNKMISDLNAQRLARLEKDKSLTAGFFEGLLLPLRGLRRARLAVQTSKDQVSTDLVPTRAPISSSDPWR